MTQTRRSNTPILVGIGLFVVCLIGAFTFSLRATFDQATEETNQRFEACATAPSSRCLLALGTSLALVQETYPQDMEIVSQLAEMGQRQDARAIGLRHRLTQGQDRKAARAQVLKTVKAIDVIPFGRDTGTRDQRDLDQIAHNALASRDYHQLIEAAHILYLHSPKNTLN